ncbi:MAG: MMPL family transporter [Solirubrobacterales bacterium]|nr:MMPL family transporter [Solirubrobacterales bacterium]
MIHLARFSIRRPVVALVVWFTVAAGLAVVGLGVSDQLSPTIMTVAGTESSRATQLSEEEFGPGVLVPVLLQGPKAQVDLQGPALVSRLAARKDTRVMSAWDAGDTGKALRPSPTSAMIVASVARSERDMVDTYQAQIQDVVDRTVSSPVHAHVTGQPTLDIALKDAAVDTTRTAELLAIPIIFLVLLLLLARPVAAGLVAVFGAATVFVSYGAMTLNAQIIDIDATAVTLASVSGLALGVGFALMVLERFLEEEAPRGPGRAEAALAASRAVATSGRAVLFAGTVIMASLVIAVLIGPTDILASVGVGVLLCSALGTGAAVVVMPAALVLLGHRVDAGRFALPAPLVGGWHRLVGEDSFVTRHAVGAGAVATAALLVLAVPLATMETGPPDVTQLPEDSVARQDFEAVAQAMGPGWPTPFNVLVVARDHPVTDVALLRQLDTYQAGLAKDPRVASVVGPGELRAQTKDLGKLPKSLEDSSKLLKNGKKDLGRLAGGLGLAGAGARQLKAGLQDAASGAGQLQSGSGSATSGAGQLKGGLAAAESGARKISAGLGSALSGAQALRAGAAQALTGSKQLSGGLGTAARPVTAGVPVVKQMAADVSAAVGRLGTLAGTAQATTQNVDQAIVALQAVEADGPQYQAALGALRQARSSAAGVESGIGGVQKTVGGASAVASAFAAQTGDLANGLSRLLAGSTALQGGIAKLSAGNAQLADGIAQLNSGGGQLATGLDKLRVGAGALESGLGQLTTGAGQLAGGLQAGTGPTTELANGLGQLQSGVAKFRGQLPSPKDVEQLQQQSPGLFDSGYFVLAAITGAPPDQRNQASFAINLDNGGSAGQIVVISKYASKDQRTRDLAGDLQDSADRFAQTSETETAVGGPAGSLADYEDATVARIAPVVAGIAIVVALLLMLMLRTVVLPLVAVAFDLLTASAAFGVLELLYGGDDPLLGGPGYVDPMSIIGIFAAVFGIAMVYEVMLLTRTREAFLASGDPHLALREGLRSTAAVSTGVALAMVAAAAPFLFTGLVTVQQFGIGLAVVAVLDAFIVRPVLLPAAVELLGRAAWWPTSRAAPGAPAPPPAVSVPPTAIAPRS